MLRTEQFPGVDMLLHGRLVSEELERLIRDLDRDPDLPGIVRANAELLRELVLPREVRVPYAVFHDCGKPLVRSVDAEGRVHYPDHAAASAKRFRELSPNGTVARLIERDMEVHLLPASGVEEFVRKDGSRFAATLLLSGFAEIRANAPMFGGRSSVGYRIKAKHLDARSRKIVPLLKGRG